MIHKCFNPTCNVPFLRFREGKIYRVDWRQARGGVTSERPKPHAEHFWLCSKCSPALEVVVLADGSVGVFQRSLPNRRKSAVKSNLLAKPDEATPAIRSEDGVCRDPSSHQAMLHKTGVNRTLILGTELRTLALVEQILQDSGLAAITTTSVAEAMALLSTKFFDVFIFIERPASIQPAARLELLAAARAHCESHFCWSAENVQWACSAFVESTTRLNSREEVVVDTVDLPIPPPTFSLVLSKGSVG